MNNRNFVWMSMASLLIISCFGQETASGDGEPERLQQQQNEFFEAAGAKDLERTVSMFADDAVLHVAGMPPVEGQQAIRRFYSNMFAYISSSGASPDTLYVASGGDMAFSRGASVNTFSGPGGDTEYTGKFLMVWEKHSGEWKIAAYSISSNQ